MVKFHLIRVLSLFFFLKICCLISYRLLDNVSDIYRKEKMLSQEEVVPAPAIHKEKKKVNISFYLFYKLSTNYVSNYKYLILLFWHGREYSARLSKILLEVKKRMWPSRTHKIEKKASRNSRWSFQMKISRVKLTIKMMMRLN